MESMQGVSKTINLATKGGRPREVTFTIPAGGAHWLYSKHQALSI